MADDTMKKYRDPLTYRHPRTLIEAFGPYEGGNLQEPEDRARAKHDSITTFVSFIAAVLVVIFAVKAAV